MELYYDKAMQIMDEINKAVIGKRIIVSKVHPRFSEVFLKISWCRKTTWLPFLRQWH